MKFAKKEIHHDLQNTHNWYFCHQTTRNGQEHFDLFIQQALKQGRYKNAREVIRAGLRLLEHEEQKVSALQAALEEGEKSSIAKNFNPKKHLKKIKTQRK